MTQVVALVQDAMAGVAQGNYPESWPVEKMCSAIVNNTFTETYNESYIGFRADRIAKLAAGYLQVAGSTPDSCGQINITELESWDIQICSEIPMPADGGGAGYQAGYSWYDFWQTKYNEECMKKYGTVPDYTFPVD